MYVHPPLTAQQRARKNAGQRERYASDPELRQAVIAATKARHAADPDRTREYAQRWYAENADRLRPIRSEWYAANKEVASANGKAWYAANPELRRELDRAWRAANPERAREISRRKQFNRRARKRAAFVELVDPGVVYERDHGVCRICDSWVLADEKWHVDHIVPLVRGGLHAYSNVQLAHARCNLQKGPRPAPPNTKAES